MTAFRSAQAIAFRQSQIDLIDTEAEAAYPEECCGLLAGQYADDGVVRVSLVVPSPNLATQDGTRTNRDRFEVDPQVRFDLMRDLEGGPDAMIGHYHSHPGHPPVPSDTDLDQAYEPDLVWLIVGVEDGRAGAMRAYYLDKKAGGYRELTVQIDSGPT